MIQSQGRKTERDYWDGTYATKIRPTLPSTLAVGTRNILSLLKDRIRPGQRVLEIGCAPGKILSYVAKVLGARVSGLDYSPAGIAQSRALFMALGIEGDLRCEDAFGTSFAPGIFDFVYSNGLVEHFDDPRAIVRRHVELAAPGGRILILVPNYGGFYGRLQRRLDPANLAIHNLEIMHLPALGQLAPDDLVESRTFYTGHFNPWLLNFDRALPRPVAMAAWLAGNALGLLQPVESKSFAPLLALEMTRIA